MLFTKKDLNFLSLMKFSATNKSLTGNKVQIKNINNSIIASQISDKDVSVISILKDKSGSLDVSLPTSEFFELLSSFDDSAVFDIDKSCIRVNNSKYEFESLDFDNTSSVEKALLVLDSIKSNSELCQKITINDLKKISLIKNYVGSDGLDVVGCMNNYFVASNRTDVTACIKLENEIDKEFFIPKQMADVINFLHLDTIEYYITNEFHFFVADEIIVIFPLPINGYSLSNIFDDSIKEAYDHPYMCTVNKEEFKTVIKRISILARNNADTRIFVMFYENELVIESKDSGYAIEKINAITSKELNSHYVILSANYINSILNLLTGDTVCIFAIPDKDAVAVKIDDDKKNMFFVHCLYYYPDDSEKE